MSNIPRGFGVFFVYFFAAPVFAAIMIMIGLYVSSPPTADSAASVTGLMYAGFALLLAYSLGALPAIATGIVAAVVSSRIRQGWLWVALCVALGAGSAWLFGNSNWAGLPLKPQDLQVGLLGFGALTSLICALTCVIWRPRRVA